MPKGAMQAEAPATIGKTAKTGRTGNTRSASAGTPLKRKSAATAATGARNPARAGQRGVPGDRRQSARTRRGSDLPTEGEPLVVFPDSSVSGEPALRPPGARITVSIAALRPTQITVGASHVEQKKHATMRQPDDLRHLFLRQHAVQVVIGPQQRLYIADHHHWARAWHELGIEHVPAIVKVDLHHLPEPAFWLHMLDHHLVHPYDEEGRRQPLGALPPDVAGMRDDPYRSLEAFARQSGGYRKVEQAYPDFRWADFFRREIQGPFESVADMASALVRAVRLARSPKAKDLPGYIGKGESA